MEAPIYPGSSSQKYPSYMAPATPMQQDKHFKCGCGKNLLSFAALGGHVQCQHNGKFPENCSKQTKRKAGRPRTTNILEDSIMKNSAILSEQPPITISHNFAAEFQSFLGQCPGCRDSNKEGLEERVESLECPKFGHFLTEFEKFRESVRTMIFRLADDYNSTLVDAVEVLVCNPREEKFSSRETLCLFLLHISKYVSQEFLSEIAMLLTLVAKFLDTQGWETFELLKTEFRRVPGKFSDLVTAEYFPDMSNHFILTYFLSNSGLPSIYLW